jgi:hypothetical protein
VPSDLARILRPGASATWGFEGIEVLHYSRSLIWLGSNEVVEPVMAVEKGFDRRSIA